MKRIDLFSMEGHWYKANFHSHSTNSDGKLTPEEMKDRYKAHGYQILAFSEHERYTNTTAYDEEDFLVYPAIERSITLPDKETFHIHGIMAPHFSEDVYHRHLEEIPVPDYHSMQDVQQIIDELKAHGNFVMINHPYWSFNTFEHLHTLKNYDFIEVYNHNCHVETDLGNSEIYYDELLKERSIYALATDDNHNSHRYKKGVHMWDSFGGFTMLQAPELSRQAIGEALQKGHFYASSGPLIQQITLENNCISVACSPCSSIVFKAYPRHGYRLLAAQGEALTSGKYQLRGQEQWIRVKCIDADGRCAWSNPIYINEE